MRNWIIAGLGGVLLAGGVGAANAANPNVPSWSPYAIGTYQAGPPASVPGRPAYGDEQAPGSTMVEGRAAYVDPGLNESPHARSASRGGDIVVHTGRSYLDPGTSAEVGTEDRYFYDTAHYDFHSEGPDFTRDSAGFELLDRP